MRLVASREIAAVGGAFTSRGTRAGLPLNPAGSVPESARTSRMICTMRARCRAADTRYLVRNAKWGRGMNTRCLPLQMSFAKP